MVKIVTGKINSFKTTKIKKIFDEKQIGDGLIAEKIMRGNLVYGYKLIRLKDKFSMDFIIRDIYDDSSKDIIYKLGPYHFYQEAFSFINKEIQRFIKEGVNPVFLDEISLLELNNMGYYQGLLELLKANIDLYLVVRRDLLERVLQKFKIEDYEII